MGNLLRNAVQVKKKDLINKLIKLGIYKKNEKHLYELTLGELEKEYKLNKTTNDLVSISKGRSYS